jgi:hypothetical protein
MDDAEKVALAGRLKEARLATAYLRKIEISQDGMAAVLSETLGRQFHPTQWRRYESGKSEPPLEIIRALASVSGLTESYIAFGVTEVGIETLDPSKDRKLTMQEIQRARLQAAREEAEAARRRKAAAKKQQDAG